MNPVHTLYTIDAITIDAQNPPHTRNFLRVGVENGEKLVCITRQSSWKESFTFLLKRIFGQIDTSFGAFERFRAKAIVNARSSCQEEINGLLDRIDQLQTQVLNQELYTDELFAQKQNLENSVKETRKQLEPLEQRLQELVSGEQNFHLRKASLDKQEIALQLQEDRFKRRQAVNVRVTEELKNRTEELRSKTLDFLKEGMTPAEYVKQASIERAHLSERIKSLLTQLNRHTQLDRYDTPEERADKIRRERLVKALRPIADFIQDGIHDQTDLTKAQEDLDTINKGFSYSYYSQSYAIAPITDDEKNLIMLMRTLASVTYNYKKLMAMNAPFVHL